MNVFWSPFCLLLLPMMLWEGADIVLSPGLLQERAKHCGPLHSSSNASPQAWEAGIGIPLSIHVRLRKTRWY